MCPPGLPARAGPAAGRPAGVSGFEHARRRPPLLEQALAEAPVPRIRAALAEDQPADVAHRLRRDHQRSGTT